MHPTGRSFLRGVTDAAPFLIVIVPFAMLFGVLAAEADLDLFEIVAFSVTVFAGASQFAALALLQENAPVLVILATALAVNLRMMMYSVALAPHFGAAPVGVRAVMAYFLIDQSFALSLAEFDKRKDTGVSLDVFLKRKSKQAFYNVSPFTLPGLTADAPLLWRAMLAVRGARRPPLPLLMVLAMLFSG